MSGNAPTGIANPSHFLPAAPVGNTSINCRNSPHTLANRKKGTGRLAGSRGAEKWVDCIWGID
jgi:hypothetical protein